METLQVSLKPRIDCKSGPSVWQQLIRHPIYSADPGTACSLTPAEVHHQDHN